MCADAASPIIVWTFGLLDFTRFRRQMLASSLKLLERKRLTSSTSVESP